MRGAEIAMAASMGVPATAAPDSPGKAWPCRGGPCEPASGDRRARPPAQIPLRRPSSTWSKCRSIARTHPSPEKGGWIRPPDRRVT